MHDGIIGETLKRQLPILRRHPPIKGIMQKQIGQQRADDSPNAKENFEFERRLPFRQKSSTD
jgi:hypothetical protein